MRNVDVSAILKKEDSDSSIIMEEPGEWLTIERVFVWPRVHLCVCMTSCFFQTFLPNPLCHPHFLIQACMH